ncbi:winged helix-turn-helix transcriptional regulator [Rahnella perminowiae]|uniref:Helix-turn-helix transcriptional regulator n=2 Tax=Rahnella perminowiae TaxID=2816244 RepID=A0ABS6KXI3_9GAMM|nr:MULTISPECIES: helix-turn-helix domain-containing protein [Rahnella]MBU9826611.1 helix-turn-helix transcriptional regulator [Rahnella perminowiae]MBU9834064.1 helix-turn-helix transcriptional regulator [Rahnella perminowiae]MCR9002017.1 helix-turn-helix transcriptional regulator [Rahnella perminowiae]
MKRTRLENTPCPAGRALDLIGDWWTLLIVRDAMYGISRFSEFQRSLGAAKNILSTRLKALVAEGILKIEPAADGSAYQDYVLTEKGRALQPVLVALGQWGSEYLFEEGEACTQLVDIESRQPLRKLEIHAQDGRVLESRDITAIIPEI